VRYLSIVFSMLVVLSLQAFAHADDQDSKAKVIAGAQQRLQDADPKTRVRAAVELGRLGPEAKDAVPALTKSLEDADPTVAAASAMSLARIGEAAHGSIPNIAALLPNEQVTTFRAPVWFVAGSALGDMGEVALPQVLNALEGEDEKAKLGGAAAVVRLGPKAREAVPALTKLLASPELQTKDVAILALGAVGPEAASAVPALIDSLGHENFNLVWHACNALEKMGETAAPAVPRLLTLMKEGNTSVRRHAAAALGGIGPVGGQKSLQSLVDALNDQSAPVRDAAVIALGQLGPFAEGALPHISAALDEKIFTTPVTAARSFWQISGDPSQSLAIYLALLHEPDYTLESCRALGELGAAAAPAVEALAETVQSEDHDVRLAAIIALGQIGPAAKEARPVLQAAAQPGEEEDIQAAAKKSLEQIDAN
jgi:HEAT repeat protein